MDRARLNANKSELRPELRLIVSPGKPRVAMLDLARGLAVCLMIVFHTLFDLKTFVSPPSKLATALPAQFWTALPTLVGTLFFLVLGAAHFEQHRVNEYARVGWLRRLAPGAKLLLVALGISVITNFFTPHLAIYFGVLHCMGVAKVLLIPARKLNLSNLAVGVTLVAAGNCLGPYEIESRWLLWLGVSSRMGSGGDWYPILPWVGVAYLGYFGMQRGRSIALPRIWISGYENIFARPAALLRWLGRHSLLIYLLHQPALIGAMRAFSYFF
jgi:uncharacterized membrane protein